MIKGKKGITLIALVITIIVLLILAGVSISALTGDNGLLNQTQESKQETQKSYEKEKLQLAVMSARTEQIVEEAKLRNALKEEIENGEIELYKTIDSYDVLFKTSNRYYDIDENGDIEGGEELVIDYHPGDITKDVNGNILQGTEEHPYEINCIEDLVAFSNIISGGYKIENGNPVEITKTDFLSNKYVILKRNLNFKSRFSYTDNTRTDFGDINGNTEDGNQLMTEMTTGKGFKPIGYNNKECNANFDGKNKKIRNIYINYTEETDNQAVGLFGYMNNGNVKNIQLTGKITGNWHAGGIVGDVGGYSNCRIEDCINYADVSGNNMVGGIAGRSFILKNCVNYGNVSIDKLAYSYGGCGGILGSNGSIASSNYQIENCENYGNIKGKTALGGILGATSSGTLINNSSNYGNIDSEQGNLAGGIVGMVRLTNVKILNCHNEGSISGNGWAGGIAGGLSGGNWDSETSLLIQNCYNTGKLSSTQTEVGGIIAEQAHIVAKNYLTIENTWNIGELEGIEVGGIQGKVYKDARTDTKTQYHKVYYISDLPIPEEYPYTGEAEQKTLEEIKSQEFVDVLNDNIGEQTEWRRWELGEKGYPVLRLLMKE